VPYGADSAARKRSICSHIGRGADGVAMPCRPSTFSHTNAGPAVANAAGATRSHAASVSHAHTSRMPLARASPGKLSFASGSNGSAGHLAGELFKTLAGIDIVHLASELVVEPTPTSWTERTDFFGRLELQRMDTAKWRGIVLR